MNKKCTNLEVKREQLYYEASLNYLKPVINIIVYLYHHLEVSAFESIKQLTKPILKST